MINKRYYSISNTNNEKTLRIMKLMALFLCIGMSVGIASNSYSQSTLLTFKAQNKTVKDVFDELEKKSEYMVFYLDGIVDLNRQVTIDVNQQTVNKLLDQLFNGTNNSYEINNRQIIIYKKNEKPQKNIPQREKTITGRVLDEHGVTLPGVTIVILGSTSGVITDLNGEFKIDVSPTDKLQISYIGYIPQQIVVGEQTKLVINMKPKVDELEEVVVTAWATQKKTTMVGAVTAINPKELKGPTSNVTTMMAGRVAGIIAYQTSGEPGRDNANFFIRGITTFGAGKVNPLILINGIESSSNDLARIQPDDIAGFSVLKDASAAALYGSRGANGVILVTTKNGVEGKTKVNARYEASLSSNTQNFKLADNITYMKLANEATLTRDPLAVRPYSLEKIAKTEAGADPLLYPNNDWMGLMVRDFTMNHRFNMNISGGGTKAAYYIAGTANVDNGILRKHSLNDFNSNVKSNNYELRANVDMKFTPTTVASVRFSGRFSQYNGPIDGGGAVFNRIMTANPVKFPAIYPQSLLSWAKHPLFGSDYYKGTTTYGNPYAYALSGYSQTDESNVIAQIELKQDFDFITKGLKARVMAYTKRYSYFDLKRRNNPFYYNPVVDQDMGEIIGLHLLNEGSSSEYLNYEPGSKNLNTYNWIEGVVNWNRLFNGVHDMGAMLVACGSNYLTANASSLQLSLPSRNLSLSGRLNYAYDSRYMMEINFGYNGSERFDKKHRFGFFPSIGLAWNLAEEDFMSGIKDRVNKLKIRTSYGVVGNDEIGDAGDRFFYLSNVNMNSGGYYFGYNFDEYRNGISLTRYANSDITWEKAYKSNIALEVELDKAFVLELDFFKEKRSDILMWRSNIPGSLGLNAGVQANVGKASAKGLDATMSYQKTINKDLWLSLRGTVTYATSKVLVNEEPNYTEDQKHLSRLGYSYNQVWGLIAERYFIDDEEVENSPKQNFGNYMAGDIKYRDVNRDGQITELDRVPIGHPTVPELVYGFGFSFGVKDFDISSYFQGQARSSFWINPASIAPFKRYESGGLGYQTGLLQSIVESHWSEENKDLYAFHPRLSSESMNNNNQTSTWWMRDGSFIRLKSVEVGYNMPAKKASKLGLSSLRLYINGLNLLSFSNFKLWDVEMRGEGLGYPIQRVFNAGIVVGI